MSRIKHVTAHSTLTLLLVWLAACASAEGDSEAQSSAAAESASAGRQPVRVASIAGFDIPESAIHDPDQDVYLVTNINGEFTAKDNNGYVSRLLPDGSIENLKFIAGGVAGVTLHAPKGTAFAGDTLWIADIDALRGFDKHTGVPLASIDLSGAGAAFLNDVALGPDGTIYLSDSRSNRVLQVAPDRTVSVALQGDTLAMPNGLFWDDESGRLLVACYRGTTIFAWRPGEHAVELFAVGPGGFDGMERLADGRLVISSWTTSAVHVLADTGFQTLIEGVPSPGDIGVDVQRNRILIPILTENRVEIWEVR
ncbi:MAG: hypothetical protein AMS25_03750 [Gemmatimonas sp. SM23_52]|nr:MAG: hypothetical protein AMS25_03750 [Gemmatimonas sp. SM23_52]